MSTLEELSAPELAQPPSASNGAAFALNPFAVGRNRGSQRWLSTRRHLRDPNLGAFLHPGLQLHAPGGGGSNHGGRLAPDGLLLDQEAALAVPSAYCDAGTQPAVMHAVKRTQTPPIGVECTLG
ncbi:hypothetical protein PMIN04_012792, partial [Paraphaeosphaeria minitans]